MKVCVDHNSLLQKYNNDIQLKGKDGFCLVENELIYKIYFFPKYNMLFYDFSKYKSDLISFPMHYLYDCSVSFKDRKAIVGEIMPYFPKASITKSITETTNIHILIRNYLLMISELKKFPEIMMKDLVSSNILYDEGKGFSLIDTSDWLINEYENYILFNKKCFDFSLSNLLLDNLLELYPRIVDNYNFQNNLMKFGKNGVDLLNAIRSTLNDDCRFIEILDLYCLVFEKAGLKPINTIEDMQEYTKMLKRTKF